MPYRWTTPEPQLERLELWPHRSLSQRGFAVFILITFAFLMMPLLPLLGDKALWAMLPFVLAPLVLLWVMLRRNYRDGELREFLTVSRGRVVLHRVQPGGSTQGWEADPYDIRPELRPGPVPSYLVLTGAPREVELGAFLSPDEREALVPQIEAALTRAAGYGAR